MNYYAYIRRRCLELNQLKFKFQKLFSFLHYSDFDRVQSLFGEIEAILKKYDNV